MDKTSDTSKPLREQLDTVDLAILRNLQENARLTTKELAAKVNLSPTPVYERVRRMEQQGIIRRYIAQLDAGKLGAGFEVFCMVKLAKISRHNDRRLLERILSLPWVTECYNVSGSFDYLLKICARDMSHYRDFILNELGTLDYIASIQSTFVMARLKHTVAVPL